MSCQESLAGNGGAFCQVRYFPETQRDKGILTDANTSTLGTCRKGYKSGLRSKVEWTATVVCTRSQQ